MLPAMSAWVAGEVLGFDFETTGVDRFNYVPVSYVLVHAVDGVVDTSWSGLVDPGRDIPEGATAVHGISTERGARRRECLRTRRSVWSSTPSSRPAVAGSLWWG